MSKKLWEFDVFKEPIVNPHNKEKTDFFGLYRSDNNKMLHISGKNFETNSFKKFVDFMKKVCKVGEPLQLVNSNIHVIRGGRIMVLTVRGVKKNVLAESEKIRYDISVIVTHDSSHKIQAHVLPYHIDTGVYLPSMEIKQFFDFYEGGDAVSFMSAYYNTVSNCHETFIRLAQEQFTEVRSVRGLLDKFFPLGGSEGVPTKSRTRQRNRFNDVLRSFESDSWISKATENSFWRFLVEYQGKDQFSWSRSINEGETFFSNTFGNTQKQAKATLKSILSYFG